MDDGTFRRSVGVLAIVAALTGGAAACQNTSGGTGTPDGGGGAAAANFSPQGCGFSVAPRMEYMSWAVSAPTVGATPNIRRVRLGLGGNVQGTTGRADPSTESGFAWETDDGTLVSEVEWGTDPDPTKWPSSNRTSGVTWLTPNGLGVSTPERMHEAYVCNLSPATKYYYRVGGGPAGQEQWSDVLSFTTAPKGSTKVTIAVTGDSRGEFNNAWQILQRRLITLAPTMALFSGDMIDLATDQVEWEEWLDKAWKDADGKTYLGLGQIFMADAHGNHDNHTPLFYGNIVMPQDVGMYPQYAELFFSFDVGPVHVVMIDDAWVADPTGDMAYEPTLTAWLNADLMAANQNRTNVPWIITVHHRPEYSSSNHGHDSDVLLGRQFFAPLWQKYHVDMAFSGHDHDYERSHVLIVGSDVNNPTPSTDPTQGTVYVVCAGSGADGYSAGMSPFTATSHSYMNGGGPIGLYGLVTADAHNLTLNAYELHADASDPMVDTFTITK